MIEENEATKGNGNGGLLVDGIRVSLIPFSRATMSDEGEKTCPLCAEEMDLTDQQLRPCKRGFDICVWCGHYVMDMAEKDDIEGRCPAYCTPYNKEKIAGTASKCERLVAEMSMEKKQKSQKGKTMLNAWVIFLLMY
ncbi:putative Zinc finger, RING/FYVE/PHD-type, CCR4-NOT transcription complex subunit 4 [Helianthus annuus]|nr:putative Zinc finger, RING/FYVE/PHD-type, CCR4-NOT transcription complex subunit 4 [Helianthus annuus]